MSILAQQISVDLKNAIKNKDVEKREVLRGLSSQLKNIEIEKGKREAGLSDEEVVDVLVRLVKQRKESIEQYKVAGRRDLTEKEIRELNVLKEYLPQPLSQEELENIIEEAIEKTGAENAHDLGKVIGLIMSQNKGRVEGNQVRELILQKLK